MSNKYTLYTYLIFIFIFNNIIYKLSYENDNEIKEWHNKITRQYYYQKIGFAFLDLIRHGVLFIYIK